jgi:hypothetical protein
MDMENTRFHFSTLAEDPIPLLLIYLLFDILLS